LYCSRPAAYHRRAKEVDPSKYRRAQEVDASSVQVGVLVMRFPLAAEQEENKFIKFSKVVSRSKALI
jgi:hypothetical protein